MKRSKDRLHKVLVVGATPAGIAATNKLGELGIPVTLVDSDPDLDQKFSRHDWRLPSGISLNFAHRSGLLRIFRNPLISRILPARITSLKHTPQGFRAKVEKLPSFVDPDRCVLCGRCVEVCPVTTPGGDKPIKFPGRFSLPGRPVLDKRRQPLCQEGCPLGVNAQAYIALARVGRFAEALEVVRKDNVLPGICGRVCTHPCEMSCRRGDLDEPIAIRDIKRFLADYDLETGEEDRGPSYVPQMDESVGIVGSGPAGLAAAAELAQLGYRVTVYEKESGLGGLLRYGIGQHRLPRKILDHDLDYIRRLGVEFRISHPVDLSGDMKEIKGEHDAIIIATGSWGDRKLGVKGEDLDGVDGCVSILTRLNRGEITAMNEDVAVIGDGNAAFDLARTLTRFGARVTLLSWFPKDMIPADTEEIRGAQEEGVRIIDSTQVVFFSGRDQKLESLTCRPTKPGRPDASGIPWPIIIPESESFDLNFDRAFVAIGQTGTFTDGKGTQLKVNPSGLLEVDDCSRTSMASVYAAGDTVGGASSVVEAMAQGRSVARSVHMDLSGLELAGPETLRPGDRDFDDIPTDIPALSRPKMPEKQLTARGGSFDEVALGLSESQVITETERCLQCGICSECLLCLESCGEIGAIVHWEDSEEIIEHAGVVIIADPEAAPFVKGEDVIRAYGPKAARSDVPAMITRGFAAAALASILVGGASQRPKGHGLAFSPPDPELSRDIRMGIFACRCNDSFGWTDEMEKYVHGLTDRKGIIYSEVLLSACVPEGASSILKTIREKGLTRVVLATCVCCPLDFICSACTDQRTRLKDTLFRGTGISRSMVETCNLRGEALRYLRHDENKAMERFTGLIDRSIQRAFNLKPLPAPARNYNFTTAVIGESEASINSAVTLAQTGLEVFHLGGPDRPLTRSPRHDNIHCFAGSAVKGMSGTLGNFQVFIEIDGVSQVLEVGAVIIGDKQRRQVPYIPQRGLPNRMVSSSMQKPDLPGIPYLLPGATPIAGLFLANPKGINVSQRKKGLAAAILAAAIMPRGPRQNKGYTVTVKKDNCRGCGRCLKACTYQAISLKRNAVGGWYALVDEALCKGCGNCISVCPSNAADSPYRDHEFLEHMLEEVLM